LADELANELFGKIGHERLTEFKKYHADNPHVYSEFKKLAYRMKSTGRKRYSASAIINVLRWHKDLETTGDTFKLNNNYTALYSRLLVYHHYDDFKDFFSMREKHD